MALAVMAVNRSSTKVPLLFRYGQGEFRILIFSPQGKEEKDVDPSPILMRTQRESSPVAIKRPS